MQDAETNPSENESTEALNASLITKETDYVPEATGIQEPTNPEPGSRAGLPSGCIVRVVIESRQTTMEEVVSDRNLGGIEVAENFSMPEVLQQSQLVTEVYGSSVDLERMVESISDNT